MKLKNINIKHFKGLESVEINSCGNLNAFIGKNNSGKSSILHAVDMAGLALSVNNWGYFQPKLEIKDMFSSAGEFEVNITYDDDSNLQIKARLDFGPSISPTPTAQQKFKSILILPDPGVGLIRRENRTPNWIMSQIETRNYSEINALQILCAIKYYAHRNERELTPEIYQTLIDEIKRYFPDLESVESDRTEHDVATLTYVEYGKKLDILYSGTGLKHFLDVLLKTTISGANVVLIDEPELGLHADLQRRFMEYLGTLATEKNIQFFLATQSQIILNYADSITFYKVINTKGKRSVLQVNKDTVHTLLGDLGIRPSDVFNQDMCLLVEGASEVIFFEHIIRNLYKNEFDKVAVGIQQYGGGAASGIIHGHIEISNIIPAQKYIFWTHDRDAKPSEPPATDATQFKNAIERAGFECHIWDKREIEYYYPEIIHKTAQQNDVLKETKTSAILNGDQSMKYRNAAKDNNICVPQGSYLRKLLKAHLTSKTQLAQEIQDIIEKKLILWRNQILGM